MLFETALQLIEARFEAKTGKHLTYLEKEILKAAWDNEPYNTVANSLYLSVGYIKDLAYPLWQQVSDLFGKKVNKNNFRNLLTEQSAISTVSSQKIQVSDIDQEEILLEILVSGGSGGITHIGITVVNPQLVS
ncbi:hypothetical protein H6G81_20980 [Scytonema hofmannii FACHB-248]|uniref:vWA-MoxR associated protein N-terminal HTH domain-containing protein n=1 Tax=Scytonema hofmannii FACHB-248 TaxID=1842502 RepID=A0ABR8GV40_9CYAN|nr:MULTISPECIES: hypothetical protein [Nostocales]MBD2606939.1 hypothetical protein [Scytonema hofmannii FACHB-248]